MKTNILLAAAVMAVSSTALAGNAIDAEIYGQVNKGIMFYDDGQSTEFNVVDNNNARTKFGFSGEQALDNGLTASVLFEVDAVSNNSNAITQQPNGTITTASTSSSSGGTLTEGVARVGLAGDWGALFVGQQDTAIDDSFYHDLAGANDVMTNGFASHGGGLQFRTTATGKALQTLSGTAVTASNLALGFDGGIEQQDSLRYNSPSFNGFNFSVSGSQGGDIDTNFRYNGKHDAIEVDGAIGIGFENSGTSTTGSANLESTTSGSLSVKHDGGLAATVAYYTQSYKNLSVGAEEPSGSYFKVGYAWDDMEVAADYAATEGGIVASTTKHELTSFGLAAQKNLGNGVSLSGLYRNYDADITGTPTEGIDVFALNLKVVF